MKINIISPSVHSVNTNKVRVDGVAAVIGDYIVLDSDVDKMYIELQSMKIGA